MTTPFTWPERVTLCEVGLRDGLQNESVIPTLEQKLRLLDSVLLPASRSSKSAPLCTPRPCPRWLTPTPCAVP